MSIRRHYEDSVPPTAGGTSLLGVTLIGPPPIDKTYFVLQKGVAVLYGLNGAGKTVVLRGLASAFSGQVGSAGDAMLHIQLPPTEEIRWPATILLRAIADTLGESLTARWLQERGTHPPMDTGKRSHLSEILRGFMTLWLRHKADTWRQVEDEVISQSIFSLRAVGSDVPSWEVWISARCGPSTPLLEEMLRRGRNADILTDAAARILMEEREPELPEWGRIWSKLRPPGAPQSPPSRPRDVFELMEGESFGVGIPSIPQPGVQSVDLVLSSPLVPMPLFPIGRLDRTHLLSGAIKEGGPELMEETLDAIRYDREGRERRVLQTYGPDKFSLTEKIGSLLEAASALASETYASILIDAPALRLRPLEPDAWLHRPAFRWEARDRHSASWLPLDKLSKAQKRWAEIAARLALSALGEGEGEVGPILIDEPEDALHANAERHMILGLTTLAKRFETPIIVATHSAQLLNDPSLQLHHVYRDAEGSTQIETMESPLREELSSTRLGLATSELLQLYRVFLLVEGTHDEVVLRGLVGDMLEDARTHILPFRGTSNLLHVIDAQILIDFTDAGVVVALDRVQADVAVQAWREASTLLAQEREKEAILALRAIRRIATPEASVLYEFCRLILERGRADRIAIAPLDRPDIIQYLPVTDFVPHAETWQDVVEEWRGTGLPFKRWLFEVKGALIDRESIQRSVTRMDSIPDDILRVAAACADMARTLTVSTPSER